MSAHASSGYRSLSIRTFHPPHSDNDDPFIHTPSPRSPNPRSHDIPPSPHDPILDRSLEIHPDTPRSHRETPRYPNDTPQSTTNNGTLKTISHSQRSHLRIHLVTNSRGYVQLDLQKRDLLVIPIEVFLFSRLEVLKLSRNHIQEVPLAISRLRSLKFLYLDNNALTFLPETISNCINLVELNVTRNKLGALPTNIGMLRNLRVLRLGQNSFECLPHEMELLENLRYLDIHSNHLWYLPFSICKLNKLKYLNLSNNRFEHLPLPVCKITTLRTLTLRGNNLMNLLPDFDNLRNLQELNLAFNRFEMIPQSVFRLKTLMYLNLAGNQLQTIPTPLTMLKSLRVLHAQGNKISRLPESFPSLQYLNVANNKLLNFSVAQMKHLRSLNANGNFLENIPMGVYSLTRLASLRLNTNWIKYVSPDVAHMRKLRTLSLGNNRLINIPQDLYVSPDVAHMRKLRTLDLGNNRLINIPQVLQQLDRLDYFNVRGNKISDNISLHNGEISLSTDFYKKRRMYQTERSRNQRKRNRHGYRKRSKSLDNSTTLTRSQSTTFPPDNRHKMWDSEDLLENGFSHRHLETSSNSAHLHARKPYPSRGYHGNSVGGRSVSSLGVLPGHKLALISGDSEDVVSVDVPVRTTDYQLLGICNQVEMLLNKQLLHPVLSLKGHDMGKSFSEKAIVKTPSGLWRLSNDKDDVTLPGLVATTTETFTVTPQGGWLSSSYDANISIFLPSKAVSSLTQAQMKILKVEAEKMRELRRENRMISNILTLGPIVYLKNLAEADFNHQVTITIPAPTEDGRGHLHLLTIREDNSCVPCSSGYQHKNGYIVLRAWNLAGKAAVTTRAKCKYKACKSMEQLLNELTIGTEVKKHSN